MLSATEQCLNWYLKKQIMMRELTFDTGIRFHICVDTVVFLGVWLRDLDLMKKRRGGEEETIEREDANVQEMNDCSPFILLRYTLTITYGTLYINEIT